MSAIASRLALLQYGDSFFPSGSISFSWGLEGLVERGAVSNAASFETFMVGQLRSRWAAYERSVVAAAHAAHTDLDAVAEIDRMVEVTTPAAELRSASRRMGAAMLLVFARLGHQHATAYRALIAKDAAFGHLAVMQGMLWAGAGLSLNDATALSAHGFCTGLLGAGVRLGCLTHLEAQRLLSVSRGEASELAMAPLVPLSAIATHAPEAEIAAMQHALRELRLFAN